MVRTHVYQYGSIAPTKNSRVKETNWRPSCAYGPRGPGAMSASQTPTADGVTANASLATSSRMRRIHAELEPSGRQPGVQSLIRPLSQTPALAGTAEGGAEGGASPPSRLLEVGVDEPVSPAAGSGGGGGRDATGIPTAGGDLRKTKLPSNIGLRVAKRNKAEHDPRVHRYVSLPMVVGGV